MKQTFLLAILFTLLISPILSAFSQSVKEELFLLKRFEFGTSLNQYDELRYDADFYYQKLGGQFVIRICSNQPFIFSYRFATGTITTIMHRFKRDLNISADKFIFLRSDDCASKDAVEIPTEVWWIPDENSLPPHLEKFKPCQIKGVFSSKDYRNDYEYEQSLVVLKRTVNSLNKKGGKFLGFVIGDYHKTPNKLLLKRLNKAKRILSKEIRNGLVTVKTRKEKNSDLVEFVKGNFPLLQISKITEICD